MVVNEKVYSRLLLFLFVLSFIYIIFFVLCSDFNKLIFNTPDDASYYLKIAQNFSHGRGFSFDGINATNGFQPLWQYLIIPILFLKFQPELTLRLVYLLQIILLSISGLIFYKTQSEFFNSMTLFPAGIIFLSFVFLKAVNGMESALLIFMISLLYYYSIKKNIFQTKNLKQSFVAGIIFGFVILSRLDMIFLAASAAIFGAADIFLNENERRNIIKKILAISSGAAVILLPYIVCNYIQFSNIIPISGYLKSDFPPHNISDKLKYIFGYRESIFVFAAPVYLIWFLFIRKKDKLKNPNEKILQLSAAILSLFVLIYFLYVLLFLNWVIFSWYFIPYSLYGALVISIPVNFFIKLNLFRYQNKIFILVCSLLTFYGIYRTYYLYEYRYSEMHDNWNIESYNAAQWIKNNTGKDEVLAMKDAGHLSYFGERSIINLDGLVNNFEYQEIIKDKVLNQYLKINKVKYIVQHAIWNREDITDGNYDSLKMNIVSHKYSTQSDTILVRKRDEVYRSGPYMDGEHRVSYIIWKLNE